MRLCRAVTAGAAQPQDKLKATACSSGNVYSHGRQVEFSPRDMVHSVLSRMGSRDRGLGSHGHTLWLSECSELKVLDWGHSANDVRVNVQILMGAVQKGGVLWFGLLRENLTKLISLGATL